MTGWMLRHARMMLFIFWTDMLMPFLLVSLLAVNLLSLLTILSGQMLRQLPSPFGWGTTLLLILAGSIFGFGARNIRIMKHIPLRWILFFPVIILVLSVFMAPVRLIGLARCADGITWGTRNLGTNTHSPEVQKGALFWRICMRSSVPVCLALLSSFAWWIEYFH